MLETSIAKDDYGLPARKSVLVGDDDISYVEMGEGEPIILLHGYPQSLLMWRKHIPQLAKTHKVYAADWFGWGRSTRRFDANYLYWTEVDRLKALQDAWGIEKPNIIAHDYGGHLSLGFAIRYAADVRRLAVINSRAHSTFPSDTYIKFSIVCAMARTPVFRSLIAKLPIFKMNYDILEPYIAKGCFDDAIIEEYLGWLKTPEGKRWWVMYFRDYSMPLRQDLLQDIGNITCPSAVIYGDADPFCLWDTAEDLSEKLGNAELCRISGADHYSVEERPQEILSAIQALLARQ